MTPAAHPEHVSLRKNQIDNQMHLYNFPSLPTPFIGRSEEIREISKLIADPACRLLTLTGPGGIGKTRLAIESCLSALEHFSQGVYLVPLQPVRSSDLLVQAIADALNSPLSGSEDPRTQLLNYLNGKEILLVLDNFEQLLSPPVDPSREETEGGIILLRDILQTASNVKLLVTSREILNLRSEWVYTVEGMVYPRSVRADNIDSYSAVQLFVERAQRLSQGFDSADEQENIVQICQLVEGMPLALELAASWTKSLACYEIAVELQRNFDLLSTNLRDVPGRHQNMKAVFNHSWKRLASNERQVFKRLSVFQGGFQRAAAEQVVDAALPVISALVDKSLVRRDSAGRYHIHELLRQYAEEQLNQSPQDARRIHDRHCDFYADFLSQTLDQMLAGQQLEGMSEIKAELENIRQAWRWAAEHKRVPEIHKSLGALLYFYQYRSRYFEGVIAYGDAIHSLQILGADRTRDLTLAELLNAQGWLYLRLGQLDQAKTVQEESLAIYQTLGVHPPPRMGSDPNTALGVIANVVGDYGEAIKLGRLAYQANKENENRWNMMFALYVLTTATLSQGDVAAAGAYAQEAYALTQEIKDSWFRAFILNDLGSLAFVAGEYDEAQNYFRASYTTRKDFDDPGGMAEALNHLAKIAANREDYLEARKLFQESLSMYQEINDRGGVATTLDGLGMVACATGDYRAAGIHFKEALHIAIEMQYLRLAVSITINIAELWLESGQELKSAELLAAVLHHPACAEETKNRAELLLNRCQSTIQPDLFEEAKKRGQAGASEDVLISILTESVLLVPEFQDTPDINTNGKNLIESLTSRELEVLHLIAEGQTNKGIAETLVITLGTVKWYNNQIYSKLNVSNRTQAVARARELRLLP